MGGLDEEAPGGAEVKYGHDAGFPDLADRVGGQARLGADTSPEGVRLIGGPGMLR